MALQVIDSHFHWFPKALFERLCDQEGSPRAERTEDGYRYYYDGGRSSAKMSPVWLDLDRGLEESDRVTGEGTVVIGTTGVLAGRRAVDDGGDAQAEPDHVLQGGGVVELHRPVASADAVPAEDVVDHSVGLTHGELERLQVRRDGGLGDPEGERRHADPAVLHNHRGSGCGGGSGRTWCLGAAQAEPSRHAGRCSVPPTVEPGQPSDALRG